MLVEPLERYGFAAERFCQSPRLRGVTIAAEQPLGLEPCEAASDELCHLARADAQDGFVVEMIEDAARVIDGNAGDTEPPLGDARLGHHLLPDGRGALEERVEDWTGRARIAGGVVRFAHLAEDLRLANDHRIQR